MLVRTFKSTAAVYEKVFEIKDRTYRLQTFPACFVGREAVTTLVNKDMAVNREEATVKLQQLLETGLIRHVTNDHSFEDAYLFYDSNLLVMKRSISLFFLIHRFKLWP